jgi:hypothetical protein
MAIMTAHDYADFDLEVTRLPDGRYRASARFPGAGENSVEFETPFSNLELENLMLKMGWVRGIRAGPARRRCKRRRNLAHSCSRQSFAAACVTSLPRR